MSDYFENLQAEIDRCYDTAHRARAKGFDPDLGIDAVPAGDLSARVEGLVGPVGIAEEIKRVGRENITKIIDAILDGKFDVPRDKLVEQALRTSLAILTEGVVAAPIEGISDVKIKENPDGSRYLSIYFAGPIRSAGGTAQGLAVLIGAYISRRLGLNEYRPTNDEIERYVEEIRIYNDRVTNLQYVPSEDDIRTIIKNVPVCIDGDPTEEMEVSIHRRLKRVETDRIRGGMCLVTAEGIAQKAKKLMKKAGEFGIDWGWLSEIGRAKVDSANEKAATAKFMGEVVGGRPILSEPSAKGGFRLRYGRCRATGIAAKAIHPATAILLDGFIATGTQMRIEKPGKGCIATVCDEIEGPIVRLKGGNVVMVETEEAANEIKKDIEQILFLGDLLVSYGDFLQTNTPLLPAGYCEEWWQEESGVSWRGVTCEQAVQISKDKNVPLHPRYTYRWEDVTVDDLKVLADAVGSCASFEPVALKKDADVKRVLEEIAAPHTIDGDKIFVGEYAPFLAQLGYDGEKIAGIDYKKFSDAFDAVSSVSTVRLRRKSGTYIGARMGRPEKAKERKMQPAVHVLFPIGKTGGREQMVNVAAERRSLFVDVSNFKCPSCGKKTITPICECGGRGNYLGVSKTEVMIQDIWRGATSRAGIGNVKGVEGMISEYKIPEPLEKGILRAKNEVFVFKDGTCRFDATDAPVTHVRPREIGVGVEKLRELGYEKDYLGGELKSEDQIIELFVQDIVVPLNGADYIIQVSRFVDDLLERFYAMEPYYRIENRQGLLGKLVVGLAPHTSAGIIGRVVGFTDASVCFAHPYWHTAKRRNCLVPETEVLVLNSNNPRFVGLGDFFESVSGGKIVDDRGTIEKGVEGISTFALNPATCKFEKKRVVSVIKTPAPEHLVEVRTKSGRIFTSSPEHRLLVNSDGNIVFRKVLELKDNDGLIVPQKIESVDLDILEIDLLKELSGHMRNVLMLRDIREFIEKLVCGLGGLKLASEKLKINKKTFSNYIYRDSIPLPVLEDLLKLCDKGLKDVPECRLGVKRDHTGIKRTIAVDDKFMRLLGYYLAEGYSRACRGGFYQVSFACTENELAEDIAVCVRGVFGIDAGRDTHVAVISNHVVYRFFEDVLKIGRGAHDKRIPPQFFALPKHKIRELLSAYFAGDGSVERGRLHVTCSSVNRGLLRDIGFLLARFGIFYRLKSERRKAGGVAKEFYAKKGKCPEFTLHYISIRSGYARIFHDEIGFSLKRKQKALGSVLSKEREPMIRKSNGLVLDPIKEICPVKSKHDFLYDIEVEAHHNFLMNDLVVSANCDGDEDTVMLLMDVLLNFSKKYLPVSRGGKMDAPLVITTLLDPKEVDDEVHKMEIVDHYPAGFYEKTLEGVNPSKVKVRLVSDLLDNDPYSGILFTHDTYDVNGPVKRSTYVKLKTMLEKVTSQLALAEKIRAIDEAKVAQIVINSHFLRDTYGNLRAFSRQKFRCVKCNASYRRVPLSGKCKCGGRLLLTVSENTVKKYLEISLGLVEKYRLPDYLKQRLELLDRDIKSVFVSDLSRQSNLSDFM
ncbi:MAG: hypothetical protein MSIBF_04810 [Candidatus Altiarchaeales archaeon IMC4]|nr:MAG: hypothetical protein MSIBF_04810 [Candidatus Altiarchaeales archaeon IMC4]